MQTGLEVHGLRGLVRALERAGREDLLDAVRQANIASARDVELAARADIPQMTGTLIGSLRRSGTERAGVVRIGGASVPYAGVIHFGWERHNIAPRPFLYDALGRQSPAIENAYVEAIDRVADAIADEAD